MWRRRDVVVARSTCAHPPKDIAFHDEAHASNLTKIIIKKFLMMVHRTDLSDFNVRSKKKVDGNHQKKVIHNRGMS